MPWLFASVAAALAGISLLGYETGRPYLLFPTLLACLLACLPSCLTWLRTRRADLPLWVIATALIYIGTIIGTTYAVHAELLTPAFRNAMIMLALPLGLVLAGRMVPDLLQPRALLLGILVLEVALVGQVFYSYYTGWGEVINSRDGIRRAFGAAGDSFTVLLVFTALLAFIRGKWLRFAFSLTAILMSSGKMALVILIIGMLASLPLQHASRITYVRTVFALLAALALGFTLTSQTVRQLLVIKPAHAAVLYTAKPGGPAKPLARQEIAAPAPTPDSTQYHTTLITHMVRGSAATGLGRIVTIGAAVHIFLNHPVTGIGYGQSGRPENFQPAAKADYFGLVEHYKMHPTRLEAESFIGNQFALVAAEQGLLGLVPFMVFAVLAALLAFRVWRQLCMQKAGMDDTIALVATAAIWSFCIIVLNQTAAWLLSGAAMTIWLALCLGLCAAHYSQRHAHGQPSV